MAKIFIIDRSTWWEGSGGSSPSSQGDVRLWWSIYYDSDQDIVNNRTKVIVDYKVQVYYPEPGFANLSGNSRNIIAGTNYDLYVNGTFVPGTTTYVGTKEAWVYHNTDGTGSFTWKGLGTSGNFKQGTAVATYSLPTIPRGTTITSFTTDSITLNSVHFNVSASNPIDYIQHSLNGGGWTDSGSQTITGLAHNTAYNLRCRVRRTDNQQWTESGYIYFTTLDIARITSITSGDLNVENNFVVNFNRNGATTVNIGIYQLDGATALIPYFAVSGSSYTFNANSNYTVGGTTKTLKQWFFDNMNTVNSKDYYIYINTNGANPVREQKKFVISNANPTFTNYTYKDTGKLLVDSNTTTSLTGSSQKFIKGISDLQVDITSANKAVANKGATMSIYELEMVGKPTATANYSSSSTVSLLMNNITQKDFTVRAKDSRGNNTPKSTNLNTNFIDYTIPTITNYTLERQDGGVGKKVKLSINGTYKVVNFGAVNNDVKVEYYYKLPSSPTWIKGTTTISLTKSSGNFSCTNVEIAGDLGANGFTETSSFDFKIYAIDKTTALYQEFTLGKGTPNIAIHKDGTAIGGAYDETLGGALQVNGPAYENGIRIANINQLYKTGPTIADLNNALTDGCYTLSGGSNGPSGVTYGTVFVVNAGGLTKASTTGYCHQTCYDAQTNNIWYRKKIDVGAWGSWKKIPNGFIGDYIHTTTGSASHSFTGVTTVPIVNVLSSKGTSLSIVNNGIKIGAGISNIKITAQGCPRWDMPAVPIGLTLMVNSSLIRIALQSETVAGQYETISVTSYLNVSENDVIYLQNYWETGTQVWWGGSTYGFLLSVEVMG